MVRSHVRPPYLPRTSEARAEADNQGIRALINAIISPENAAAMHVANGNFLMRPFRQSESEFGRKEIQEA